MYDDSLSEKEMIEHSSNESIESIDQNIIQNGTEYRCPLTGLSMIERAAMYFEFNDIIYLLKKYDWGPVDDLFVINIHARDFTASQLKEIYDLINEDILYINTLEYPAFTVILNEFYTVKEKYEILNLMETYGINLSNICRVTSQSLLDVCVESRKNCDELIKKLIKDHDLILFKKENKNKLEHFFNKKIQRIINLADRLASSNTDFHNLIKKSVSKEEVNMDILIMN